MPQDWAGKGLFSYPAFWESYCCHCFGVTLNGPGVRSEGSSCSMVGSRMCSWTSRHGVWLQLFVGLQCMLAKDHIPLAGSLYLVVGSMTRAWWSSSAPVPGAQAECFAGHAGHRTCKQKSTKNGSTDEKSGSFSVHLTRSTDGLGRMSSGTFWVAPCGPQRRLFRSAFVWNAWPSLLLPVTL